MNHVFPFIGEEPPPIFFTRVYHGGELNRLKRLKARYGILKFLFTPEYREKLKALLKEKHEFQIFAKDSESRKIIGYCAGAETIFPGFFFLVELFVVPKAQGKGIGRAMLTYVISHARISGLKGIVTETEAQNLHAQSLYEKCGFKRIKNSEWKGYTYRLVF